MKGFGEMGKILAFDASTNSIEVVINRIMIHLNQLAKLTDSLETQVTKNPFSFNVLVTRSKQSKFD